MRRASTGLAALALLACLLPSARAGAKDRGPRTELPNLIVILADDLGYTDLGCYWDLYFRDVRTDRRPAEVHPRLDTPNIDRMAREGVLFSDFLVGGSVCSASRAALLTGCYPPRLGLSSAGPDEAGALGPTSRVGLNPSEITLAELLKTRGYATACIGKWHLGNQKPFLPTRQGFDSYYGPMFTRASRGVLLMRDEEYAADTLQVAYLTDRYTQEAVDFIRQHKNQPFFLYLAHNMPHVPLGVSKRFRNQSPRGLYGDVVMNLDWSTGQIMALLERLGIAERTLVVFLSDNGPWLGQGVYAGESAPLTGGKGSPREGGFRVPCVMWWPGRLVPQQCDELATAMDIMPTAARLAGAALPDDRVIDGKDITQLLFNPGRPSPHDAFYYYYSDSLKAVRSGPWKLFFTQPGLSGAPGLPGPLFNLKTDPAEGVDRSAGHSEIVDRLTAKAARMREDLGDLLTGVAGSGKREPGRGEHPARREKK